jgi:hypothetical protein
MSFWMFSEKIKHFTVVQRSLPKQQIYKYALFSAPRICQVLLIGNGKVKTFFLNPTVKRVAKVCVKSKEIGRN